LCIYVNKYGYLSDIEMFKITVSSSSTPRRGLVYWMAPYLSCWRLKVVITEINDDNI